MIRRDAQSSRNAQGGDRVAVLLIWLAGLAPIVCPAAVFASAAVLRPSAFAAPPTQAAALQKPMGEGRVVMARPSSFAAKLEWRAAKPAQLATPNAPASLGAPGRWLQIPGAVAVRKAGFEFARLAPPPAPIPPDAPTAWVMKRFASVRALGGLRIGSGPLVLALAGVEPLAADATCRRLDGVVESCRARATSRLAVLVEGRPVSCEVFRGSGSAEEMGRCKAGDIDLAADLVRNGLAKRS